MADCKHDGTIVAAFYPEHNGGPRLGITRGTIKSQLVCREFICGQCSAMLHVYACADVLLTLKPGKFHEFEAMAEATQMPVEDQGAGTEPEVVCVDCETSFPASYAYTFVEDANEARGQIVKPLCVDCYDSRDKIRAGR